MADMKIGLVLPEQVPAVWPQVRFHIQRAIDRGHNNWRTFEDDVLEDRANLWVVYDLEKIHGAVVTQVTWDRVCEIVACGGKGIRIGLPLLRQIEFYSKAAGCNAMRIIGRKGWARMLPDYKETAVILERPL